MFDVSRLASLIKRHGCKNIVKRYGSDFEINGAELEFGAVKINLKSFSNHIIEFVKATDLAVNMDNTQYLVCEEISQMKDEDEDNKELKNDLKRIRLQIIFAISHLQNIIATIKQEELIQKYDMELGKQLKQWIKYMGDLYKDAIQLLGPKRIHIGKGKSAIRIAKIMKYQGIDERQIQDAINYM